MVLAGGKGTRLEPLTSERSKPSVPFGGRYRIIDFVLSNLINSGILRIFVLTQFKSQSLSQHLQEAWSINSGLPGQFCISVPAQQRMGDHWYRGTADAIYQNQGLMDDHSSDVVAIFGGDHIFLMNVDHMLQYHNVKKAGVTIACLPVPLHEASRFGVIQVDDDWRIVGFQEKPKEPTPIPGQPDMALASMGNYLFDSETLRDALAADAGIDASSHDFGKDVLPRLLAQGEAMYAYDFGRNEIPGMGTGCNPSYWKDVGTIDAYYEASMDLRAVNPQLDLYNTLWPVRSETVFAPPAKFVHNVEGRVGQAVQSVVCQGTIVSGGMVIDSVIGRNCRINSFSEVSQSVLMDNVDVGRGAQLFRCIVDKHVRIPAGDRIGFDPVEDRKRFHVTDDGIVVIGKRQDISLP
jgi:glucose-1-phosphate adenylyltransferase